MATLDNWSLQRGDNEEIMLEFVARCWNNTHGARQRRASGLWNLCKEGARPRFIILAAFRDGWIHRCIGIGTDTGHFRSSGYLIQHVLP